MGIIIESIALFLILLFFGTLGYFVGNGTIDLNNLFHPSEYFSEPGSECNIQSLSLYPAADCLRDELLEFYNYNIENVGELLTLEELKTQGGVCSQYSKWYCDRANEMGFKCKIVTVDLKKGIGHAFAVMSNHEGYCVLDQNLRPECRSLDSNVLDDYLRERAKE